MVMAGGRCFHFTPPSLTPIADARMNFLKRRITTLKGRNLFGKIGLFPQSYTTSDPAIFQQQPTPIPTTIEPNGAPQPTAASESPPAQLQTVGEEADAAAEPNASSPTPEEGHNRVMRATLTDVQEAIEQLGRKDRDGAGSFSFASSRDGDHTDHDTDAESAPDAEDDAVWNKGTRTHLAEKARLQQQEQQEREQSSFERDLTLRLGLEPAVDTGHPTAPPIALEMSDESDADEDEDDSRALGMLYPRREHAQIPEVNEEDEDSTRHLNGSAARSKSQSPSNPSTSDHTSRPSENGDDHSSELRPSSEFVVPERDDSEVQTATARQSSFPQNKEGLASKPHLEDDATTSSLRLEVSQSAPAPPFAPISPVSPSQSGLKQSASLSRLKAETNSSKAMMPALPSPAPSQNGTFSTLSKDIDLAQQPKLYMKPATHPSEWTVEEVVEWAKSKNFDKGVYDKFIGECFVHVCRTYCLSSLFTIKEHEITGDVLLDLDVNLLKTELEIVAFGKRMRIANAIAELRRPPSVISERTHSQSASRSLSHQHSQSQSFSAPDSANPSLHNPFSSVISAESPPHTGDIVASPAVLPTPRRDSDPGSSQNNGSSGSVGRSVTDNGGDTSTASTSIGLGLGVPASTSSPIGSFEKLESGKLTVRVAYPYTLFCHVSDNACLTVDCVFRKIVRRSSTSLPATPHCAAKNPARLSVWKAMTTERLSVMYVAR